MHSPSPTVRRGLSASRLTLAVGALLGLAACGKTKIPSRSPDDQGGGAPDGGADVGGGPDVAGVGLADPGCPVSPTARPASTPSWSSISGFRNPQTWYATDMAAYV